MALSAICGIIVALLAKNKAMDNKAALTGESSSLWNFLVKDKISILSTVVTVITIVLPLSEILNPDVLIAVDKSYTVYIFQFSARAIFKLVVIFGIGFVGYTGMDLILKLYSVANREVNKKLQEHNSENK